MSLHCYLEGGGGDTCRQCRIKDLAKMGAHPGSHSLTLLSDIIFGAKQLRVDKK